MHASVIFCNHLLIAMSLFCLKTVTHFTWRCLHAVSTCFAPIIFSCCFADRERPKLNLKDGMDTQRNGQRVYEDATSTVRVVRDMRDEGTGTIRIVRDARDEGTGTVRVVKDARDENAHSRYYIF